VIFDVTYRNGSKERICRNVFILSLIAFLHLVVYIPYVACTFLKLVLMLFNKVLCFSIGCLTNHLILMFKGSNPLVKHLPFMLGKFNVFDDHTLISIGRKDNIVCC